jgi:zinc transporter, ZIP family
MDALPAFLWGLVSGSALIIGAALGWFARASPRLIAGVMAFGSGILISAVAFDLMDEGFEAGGLVATAIGFVLGAAVYTGVSYLIEFYAQGGDDVPALQIFAGTILDGIPESVVIGLSLIGGKSIAVATVIAVFLSNIPEALSSTAGLKKAGRRAAFVFALWILVTLLSGVGAWAGYAWFDGTSAHWIALIEAIAAGALLAMIANTMIPRAFAETHQATGLVTALGFLAGFALTHGLVTGV